MQTDSPECDSDRSVLDVAAAWHVSLTRLGGDVPHGTMEAFRDWLALAGEHVEAFDRVNRTMMAVSSRSARDGFAEYRDRDLNRMLGQATPCDARPVGRRRALAWSAAAVAASLALATPWLLPVARAPGAPISVATNEHQRKVLRLIDGTRVSLDCDTLVRIRYGDRARRIDLLAGQARFEVAHDAARKFVVAAGGQEVFAVGTDFNIELADSRTIVSLLRGRIAVAPGSESPARTAATDIPATATFLGPREQLDIYPGGTAYLRRNVRAAEALAWQTGYIALENETLEQAVRRLNRYSPVKMVVENGEIGAMRVSGVFDVRNRAAFLEAISGVLPVTATREGATTMISRAIALPEAERAGH